MEKLKRTLAILSSAYDYFPDDRAKVYLAFLKDLPEEAVCRVIAELVRTEEKCPSIARIRSATEELLAVADGMQLEYAGEKWKRYLEACKKVDYYRRFVHFPDDPILEETASFFSVEEILMMPPEKLAIIRKQFLDRYKEVKEFRSRNKGYKDIIKRFPGIESIGKVKMIGGKK